MKELLSILSEEVGAAFQAAGIDREYGNVTLSNRPELCEYQCNGALASAKKFHKNPMEVAETVAEKLSSSDTFEEVSAAKPGFLNMKASTEFIRKYLSGMYGDTDRLGAEKTGHPEKLFMDYGGPNVAKPLHVGHLRSAVIGEAVKRLARFEGDEVTADVHLGDFGLQMGLIITELKERKPDLPYFDDSFTGEYPAEAPFTISELEDIYPAASAKSKEDETFHEKALAATKEMQEGRRGYRELQRQIMEISVSDLKKNYARLNVSFDLWKGESDAEPYIPGMVEDMKAKGFAHESNGALVVDVEEEGDKKTIPPCMILKSDGAALYDTTDLATLIWRMKDYDPDEGLYVVDSRQELHFIQCFRCAKKTGIVPENKKLTFLGFGTVNGEGGKPLKTRDGGVMRLEYLISDIEDAMFEKIRESSPDMDEAEAHDIAKTVSLAALKYGDLKNQPSKDYIFDMNKFISSEGDTGPYILYTIVRTKSILRKFAEAGGDIANVMPATPSGASDKALAERLCLFQSEVKSAYENLSPNILCAYIYALCNDFNHFYHDTKILSCPDEEKKKGYIADVILTRRVLEKSIDLLGFEAPERM